MFCKDSCNRACTAQIGFLTPIHLAVNKLPTRKLGASGVFGKKSGNHRADCLLIR